MRVKSLPKKKIPNFFLIDSIARDSVVNWLNFVRPENDAQKNFCNNVKFAVEKINYDYYIAIIEPSLDENGMLFYEEYTRISKDLTFGQWQEKAKMYYKGKGLRSQLANECELYLFYAIRIVMELWSLEGVCDIVYRRYDGNFHFSGEGVIGGFADGIGNTAKVVVATYCNGAKYALCGSFDCYQSGYIPPSIPEYHKNKNKKADYGSGVIVIK